MRTINTIVGDALDAQRMVNALVEPMSKAPVGRPDFERLSGESRMQRRARERAEKKAAMRSAKATP
jgi:hypothetical protein